MAENDENTSDSGNGLLIFLITLGVGVLIAFIMRMIIHYYYGSYL